MYQGKYAAKPAATKQKNRKKTSIGTVIFYSLYGLFVAAALCGMLLVLSPLRAWLQNYQASQPEVKSQEIFTQLFSQPDWEALYTQAGEENTLFEDSTAYKTYMENKVDPANLTFLKTSAGLSGDKKYIVRNGNEKVATFTMTGTEDPKTRITHWELSQVELFYSRNEGVTVQTAADQTAYINGVALDDSYTTKRTETLAESYLPEGLHGYRTQMQYVDGLLVEPVVTVKNADGSEAQVVLDENGVYISQFELPQITAEEEEAAIGAAKAKGLYAIRAVGSTWLQKYYDSKSQIYKDIYVTEVFMQGYIDYWFDANSIKVTDFYRYSPDKFSAHVALNLHVTRPNGTVRIYESATTYFFTRQSDGVFRADNITNLRIQEQQSQVRLICMGDTETAMMVDADTKQLTLPQVTVPAGKTLQGWAIQETDEEGRTVMSILFVPDENGNVALSGEQLLEPMTLYPVIG